MKLVNLFGKVMKTAKAMKRSKKAEDRLFTDNIVFAIFKPQNDKK